MIKAKINATGEVVEVRPYQTEKYDFIVCRNGGIMGELYMRSELTIIGDNELDFVSLVKRMREAQSDEQAAIENSDQDNAHRFGLCARELEDKVDTWIRENYNYFETDYEEE